MEVDGDIELGLEQRARHSRIPFVASLYYRANLADTSIALADGTGIALWGRALAVLSPWMARALAMQSASPPYRQSVATAACESDYNETEDCTGSSDNANDRSLGRKEGQLADDVGAQSGRNALPTGRDGHDERRVAVIDCTSFDPWCVRMVLAHAFFPRVSRDEVHHQQQTHSAAGQRLAWAMSSARQPRSRSGGGGGGSSNSAREPLPKRRRLEEGPIRPVPRGTITLAAYWRMHAVASALSLPMPEGLRLDIDSLCRIESRGLAHVVVASRGRALDGLSCLNEQVTPSAQQSTHGAPPFVHVIGTANSAPCVQAVAACLGTPDVVRTIALARGLPGIVVNASSAACTTLDQAVRHAVDCDAADALSHADPSALRCGRGNLPALLPTLPYRLWRDGVLGDVLVKFGPPAADGLLPVARADGDVGRLLAVASVASSIGAGLRVMARAALVLPGPFVRQCGVPGLLARLEPLGARASVPVACCKSESNDGLGATTDGAPKEPDSAPRRRGAKSGIAGEADCRGASRLDSERNASANGLAATSALDLTDLDPEACAILLSHLLCGDAVLALAEAEPQRPIADLTFVRRLPCALACRVAHTARLLGMPSAAHIAKRYAPSFGLLRFCLLPLVGRIVVSLGDADSDDGGSSSSTTTTTNGDVRADSPAIASGAAGDASTAAGLILDSAAIALSPITPAMASQDPDAVMRDGSGRVIGRFDFVAGDAALRSLASAIGCSLVRQLYVGLDMSAPMPSAGATQLTLFGGGDDASVAAAAATSNANRQGASARERGELGGADYDAEDEEDILGGAPRAEVLSVSINELCFQYELEDGGRSPIDIGEALATAAAQWRPHSHDPAAAAVGAINNRLAC